MYIITKVIVRPHYNTKPSIIQTNEVICSKEELITQILPRLKRLCEAENLSYRYINSDKRVEFRVTEVADRTIQDYIDGLNDAIIRTIRNYNTGITNHNLIIKRANKKYSRPFSDGVKPTVEVNDYLKPYLMEQSYDLINDVIYIRES